MADTSVQTAPSDLGARGVAWQGFQRGGIYLVHGPSVSTYRVLPLRFLQAGVSVDEPGLFVSVGRPENLSADATLAGLDLRQAHGSGLLKMLRFSSEAGLAGFDDDQRTQALHDVSMIIRRHMPRRVVLDDLRPFLGFTSTARLQQALARFADQIASLDVTVLLGLRVAGTDRTAALLDLITARLSGRIQVDEPGPGAPPSARRLTPANAPPGAAPIAVDFARPAASGLADVVPFAPHHTGDGTAGHVLVDESDTPAHGFPDPLDRDAFGLHVQRQFHRRAVSGRPFLLIAMRGDGEAARRLDFRLLCDSTRELLNADDAWHVDDRHRRLVILMERHDDHDAQRFFARLRVRLRTRLPEHAAVYLQTFTAIVMPDGGPFESAEEFLATALDDA